MKHTCFDKTKKIKLQLKDLLIAINNRDYIQRINIYRKLYLIGSDAIPLIKEQLLKPSWGKVEHEMEFTSLLVLLSLLNDIDESEARETGIKIIESGCNSITYHKIDTILKFSSDNYWIYEFRGLKVYLSIDLKKPLQIKKLLTKWLIQVPDEDLEGLERLYIVPERQEGLRGEYMLILCNITLEWILPESYYNPFSLVSLATIQHTLYHEIGHHVHRHKFETQSRAASEIDADDYAAQGMQATHSKFKHQAIHHL